jgi:hypothetical protein
MKAVFPHPTLIELVMNAADIFPSTALQAESTGLLENQ